MDTLDDLYRRYDGPIPEWTLAAARAGGLDALRTSELSGQLRHLNEWIAQAGRTIAALRLHDGVESIALAAAVARLKHLRHRAVVWFNCVHGEQARGW